MIRMPVLSARICLASLIAAMAVAVSVLSSPAGKPGWGRTALVFLAVAAVSAAALWLYERVLPGIAPPRPSVVDRRPDARESEALYKTLIETSPDAILMLSPDGIITLANQQAVALCGCSAVKDLLGNSVYGFVAEEDRATARRALAALPEAQNVKGIEVGLVRGDGSRFPGELNASAYSNRDGLEKGFVVIVRDLGERKRLESEFLQSQKMEAIGRLAGGIAHEFNNLLTAIVGYSDLMLADPALSQPIQEDIQTIKRISEKASGLVRQLLSFSRRQSLQPRVMSLNAAVSDASNMLRRLIGENIELATRLDPDLGTTRADPVQMEQVILNLAVHARDSMPDGGKLTIETANVTHRPQGQQAGEAAPGSRGVMISITDSGKGMDEESLSRLFEPSFSAEETDRETGLGVAAAYGIIRQSGGSISVQSQPGTGTCYRIYLPRTDETTAGSRPAGTGADRLTGTETILVAEDEDSVRGMVRSSLESRGYRVLEACDGEEAARIFESHRDSISLLITDLVMPRIGGLELAQRLTSLQCGLKVLYMSGYSDELVAQSRVTLPGAVFIQKPFSTELLAQHVRRLLDSGPA